MKFIDLTQSAEFDPEVHVPIRCKTVVQKRQGGHDSNFLWTFHLITRVGKDDGLPDLPKPFGVDRTKAVEAMKGGVQLENRLKKFKRDGKLSLIPIKNERLAIDEQAASLEPCTVHLALFSASENRAWMLWHVTMVADSSKAQELVELEGQNVWVKFELSSGNPQLTMFGGRGDHHLTVVQNNDGAEEFDTAPDVDEEVQAELAAESEEADTPPRKTRRAGRKHKQAQQAEVSA